MSNTERRINFQGEEERRERIPDQELGNLLSAVGNNESKALTLRAMEGGIAYSVASLLHRVLEIQGNQPLWRMDASTLYGYCQDSFDPIGLVAQEVIDRWHNKYGYIKTPYGHEYGDALAGLMLSLSERHPFSLYQAFAHTACTKNVQEAGDNNLEQNLEQEEIDPNLNKKRAPLTRLKIFRALVKHKSPLRETDLSEYIGEKHRSLIGQHLNNLSRLGVITYLSIKADTSYVYSLNPKHPAELPSPYGGDISLSQFVYNTILEKEESMTASELTEQYVKQKGGNLQINQRRLQHRIGDILSSLRKQGYLSREEMFNKEKRSLITLSDVQLSFLKDLVETIDRFQSNDREVLQEGKEYGQKLLQDPKRVADLFRKAKETSPHAQKKDTLETQSFIFSVIKENPGSTLRTIQKELQERYQRKLGRTRLSALLLSMIASEQIDVMQRKTANYYKARE